MIRVLQNVGSLAAGGMESYLMNLYRNIDRTKVQFDFLVGDDTAYYEEEIKNLGGRVYRLPNSIFSSCKFYGFLKSHPEYKIVHSHRDAISGLYLMSAKLAGVKHRIAHSHTTNRVGLVNVLATVLKPLLRRVSTCRLACGEEAGKWLYDDYDYVVKPNAIDCSRFAFDKSIRDSVREELGLKESDIVIGHVGRFEEVKNHKFLLRVFNEFSNSNQDAKLVCVGSGSLFDDVKKQAEDLGVSDKCFFLGNRIDVNRILQAMDIILFPSFNEGFSFAMLEFQAAGLPILCSDTIPHEINIHKKIVFKSLDSSEKEWSAELTEMLSEIPLRSIESANYISEAGYDIAASSKDIQEFYLGLSEQ